MNKMDKMFYKNNKKDKMNKMDNKKDKNDNKHKIRQQQEWKEWIIHKKIKKYQYFFNSSLFRLLKNKRNNV